MPTREEIMAWINKYLTEQFIHNPADELPNDECLKEAEEIISYLHSQGVVLKVDGEPYITDKTKHCGNMAVTFLAGSPLFYCALNRNEFSKRCKNCPDFKPTELVAVESLIKEE